MCGSYEPPYSEPWLAEKAPIFVTAMGLKWVFLDFGDYQN
jgi:hypothetical protein